MKLIYFTKQYFNALNVLNIRSSKIFAVVAGTKLRKNSVKTASANPLSTTRLQSTHYSVLHRCNCVTMTP